MMILFSHQVRLLVAIILVAMARAFTTASPAEGQNTDSRSRLAPLTLQQHDLPRGYRRTLGIPMTVDTFSGSNHTTPVALRRHGFRSGYVVQFTNLSSKHMRVVSVSLGMFAHPAGASWAYTAAVQADHRFFPHIQFPSAPHVGQRSTVYVLRSTAGNVATEGWVFQRGRYLALMVVDFVGAEQTSAITPLARAVDRRLGRAG